MRRFPTDLILLWTLFLLVLGAAVACRVIIAGGPVTQSDGNQYGTNKAVNLKVH